MSYGQDFGIKRKKRKDRQLRRIRTGSPTQLQSAPQQQQQQRGAYRRPQPTGGVSTTQHPDQEKQGLLASATEGKAYVDGISGMYDTGKSAREGLGKGVDWVKDKWEGSALQDVTPDWSLRDFMPTEFLGASPSSADAMKMSSTALPSDFSMVDGTINSLGGELVGQNSSFASPVTSGMADPASGLLADSTGAMADGTTTGLQTTGGIDKLGVAGSALGVGLNVHDMVNSGVNFGNITGALGSGILGAGALGLGAANAWNPVGWGLLAASAADSIFDIF